MSSLNHLMLFNVPASDEPYQLVEIFPFVTLSILDLHIRRESTLDRVIGALLGKIEDGVVYVKNCFQVPHQDHEEIAVDMDYYSTMVKLHSQINPKDRIVGWYSTGLRDSSVLLHNFFTKEMNASPIHLIVDPNPDGKLIVYCYYGVSIELGNLQNLHLFKPLDFKYTATLQERVGLESLSRARDTGQVPIQNMKSITELIQEILRLVDSVQGYVKSVIAGGREGTYNMGVLIEEVLSLLPTNEDEFLNLFESGLQDVLMITYLSNLSKKHLQLSEQLRASTEETKVGHQN